MEKDEQIIQEIKRRAREEIRYGKMVVELVIQDGKIIAGTMKEKEIKLG